MPEILPRLAALLLASASAAALAQGEAGTADIPASDSLAKDFQDPPASARPRVWWHWMNGNVTKDGIRKDLEWMHRVGIGGVQNFDAAQATPQIVSDRLAYMTPAWKDAFRYAAETSGRLGLELAIATSPGWSQTGGPWVPPADAMKKLVWSETVLDGGKRFSGKLAPLPTVTGTFQDLPLAVDPQAAHVAAPAEHHGRIAVLAVPLSGGGNARPTRIAATGGATIKPALVMDGSQQSVVTVPKGTADKPGFVVLEYPKRQTVRSLTLSMPGSAVMFAGTDLAPTFEVERDNGSWEKVADIPLRPVPTTLSFAPVTGKKFRVTFRPYQGPRFSLGDGAPGAISGFPSMFSPDKVNIAELTLSSQAQVNDFEVKAGFFAVEDYYALDKGVGADVGGVKPEAVIDLTDRVKPDGTLDWTAPAGRWKLLSFGYSLIGKMNHPATAEATGLEVDKYDAAAVSRYMQTYLGMYRDTVGPDNMGAKGLRALLNDSNEAGAANWTPRMIEQFKRLRGYDPRPWMPTLAGVIIGSRQQSDAFLYDYRRTLADLIASEHYGTIAKEAHASGLTLYGEALEGNRPELGDDMAMRSHADIPMATLWTYGKEGPNPTSLADMKGASSIAHLLGRQFVAGESMTSAFAPWAFAPRDLKPVVDLEFAYGLNRPVIHTSVHQPVDDKVPGLSLGVFGQYFNRHESWAEMARPWVNYMARSSLLLQQGRNVADVAYFHGEEAPLTALYAKSGPADAPARYAYDFVNPDSLLNLLEVDGAILRTAGGARYQALYLGGTSRQMSLPVLRRIAALVEAGATVVGLPPQGSPSLKDDSGEFDALVKRLWSGQRLTAVGKGRVVNGNDVDAALTADGVLPDFTYTAASSDPDVLFLHRQSADADIYFLNNRRDRAERIEARFRITGKAPEIWRADTASIEPASYRIENGQTVVPLDLLPQDACFIVFRKATDVQSRDVRPHQWKLIADIGSGSWDVQFQSGRGAPDRTKLNQLASLSSHSDPAIRYFSGTANYSKSFTLPKGAMAGTPLMLDLGNIGDVAEVRVNGKLVGTVWKAPYRLDIGNAVQAGRNQLEVRVANLWVNRLIGDAQPGVTTKITYTAAPTYKPDAPLRPSGLMGPVTLLRPE